MKRVPRLSKDGVISREDWNGIASTIDANFREVTIQPGIGYNILRSPGGICLSVRASGGSSIAAAMRPLQIITTAVTTPATETEPAVTTNYLSLYPGTVGGVFPKVDGQFLWAMPSDGAGGFLEYPRMAYTLPEIGKVRNVWLKVQCVAGAVVSAICETGLSDATPPVPANTAEFAYVLLGYIRPDGSVVQQTYGNMNYMLAYALFGDGDAGNPFSHNFTPAP